VRRKTRLFFDTVLLGIIGALGAQLFGFLLKLAQTLFLNDAAGYQAPGLPNEGGILIQTIGSHGLWLIPVVITLGGIISGALVYGFAPEAEGHGTDTAVKAFHKDGGKIRARVVPIKILASAITIGSGGSAGREGPTALFSAGFGSIYAGLTHRSEKDRSLLVLIGMAAGLSAIFRSPIGTAIFAVEVLYSDMEFESEALVYTMLGAVIAYSVNAFFVGWNPLFQIPVSINVTGALSYVYYVLLGLTSGLAGAFIPMVFYTTRDLFYKIKLPRFLKPALGALCVGLIALFLPQVLGGGYGWMQLVINGKLALSLLIILMFGKLVAFALTVSSGGSGGVFAPTLFLGAMLGGIFAQLFHQQPAAFAVIGMAAVFGSAARVPIATLLMVTEMTNGYQLLVPAALAVIIGFVIQKVICSSLNLKYISLYEAQVKNKWLSPAHRTEQIKRAAILLSERRTFDPEIVGKLDLSSVLESRIPVEISNGKIMFLINVFPGNEYIGKKLNDTRIFGPDHECEIVALLRDEEMLVPHHTLKIQPEDQLLIISDKILFEKIREKFLLKKENKKGILGKFKVLKNK
jgi:CIC family chloride channel protein